jgi:hypothetical protein
MKTKKTELKVRALESKAAPRIVGCSEGRGLLGLVADV